MAILVVTLGIIFALFSALVLSYISIATMVGPWIAPTLVLIGFSLISLIRLKLPSQKLTESLAWMQAIGAGGGIIATGVGFALPMLYFLSPEAFGLWIKNPLNFCLSITGLCLTAGGLGLWIARWWKPAFSEKAGYSFPVSTLTYNVITSQSQPQQARHFLFGSVGTLALCFFRDGFARFAGLLSKTYYLVPSWCGHELALSLWPSLWAIGLSVGISIAMPLFIGLVAKYVLILPLANHATLLPFKLFNPVAPETLITGFCSGLIACELILALPKYAKKWVQSVVSLIKNPQTLFLSLKSTNHSLFEHSKDTPRSSFIELAVVATGTLALLWYFGFSLMSQALLIIFTLLATYAICQIGGKIGMVPFGRFSTFIVVPMLLLFKLNPIQTTIVCVFFDICAATASDLLFDYKTGELCGLDAKKMYRYQWIGLIATAIGLGLILWFLFTNLQIGSEAFFAQRAKAKALLLQSFFFDKYALFFGFLFGWLLKKFKINGTMVFGGLIMPNSISIGLIIGSLSSKIFSKKEAFQPFCGGILAADSLWVLLTIFSKRP